MSSTSAKDRSPGASSLLKRNIIGNAFGQAWTALVGFAVIPFYLKILGAEGYGVVAFLMSLQAILAILDLGLSTTSNKEVARLQSVGDAVGVRNLVRTLELLYWGVAAAVAGILCVGSGFIIRHAMNTRQIPLETLRSVIIAFGISLGFRWPVALYMGVLRGLERQVILSLSSAAVVTVRHGLLLLALVTISPTVLVYAYVLISLGLAELVVYAAMTWFCLPRTASGRPRFDPVWLRSVFRFATTMTLISVLSIALTQIDKITISALLPIDKLGFYSTVSMLCGGITLVLVQPTFNAVFPRFSALRATNSDDALSATFHRSAQFVSLFVAPAAAVLMFFPGTILSTWSRSPELATETAPALAVFAFGVMMNSMMHVPYAMQLASGLESIGLWVNSGALVIQTPLTYLLVRRYGLIGGAMAYALTQLGYYLVVPHLMHRSILLGHKAAWIFRDTLPYLLLAIMVFGLARLSCRGSATPLVYLAMAGGAGAYALLTLPFSRQSLIGVRTLQEETRAHS